MKGDLLAAGFVVSAIGDEEVGFSIEGEGGEVFPVDVFGAFQMQESARGALGIGEVDGGSRAAVVDQPEEIGIVEGEGEATGFGEHGVTEADGFFRGPGFQCGA